MAENYSGAFVQRDWIEAPITMKRGLTGVKPESVCHWAFEVVGADPVDELVDLFPYWGGWDRLAKLAPANRNVRRRGCAMTDAPSPLFAISLWQPWASFIAIGVKPYETRHWRAPQRLIGERVAIHAAKRKPDRDDLPWWERVSGSAPLPLGAFVCTALLVACHSTGRVPSDEYGDYGPGRFAWELREVIVLDPPVPALGRQGIWRWDGAK